MNKTNFDDKQRQKWERIYARGRVKYVLSVVVFQAWVAALFFAVFTFFPFTINHPLDRVDNPTTYFVFWTIMGLVIGLLRWSSYNRKFGTPSSSTGDESAS